VFFVESSLPSRFGQFESSNPLDATIGGGLAGKAEHGSVGGRGHDLGQSSKLGVGIQGEVLYYTAPSQKAPVQF